MKTITHSLLFIALAASGNTFAQDPHAGHGTATTTATDPHAGHAAPKAKTKAKPAAQDAHAGHAMPAPKNDPHAGHAATTEPQDPHAGHDMPAPAKDDPHAGHDMSSMDHSMHGGDPHAGHAMPAKLASDTPREPIPVPTSDDFDAAFPVLKPHAMEHAPAFNSLVVVDHLEAWDNAHGNGQSWGINAWLGTDLNRLWIRSEGERSDNALGDWSVDALYGHSISPWWDVVTGVRQDNNRESPDLTRAAIGFQGMAPYKFEISAMAYIGGPRKAELAFEAEYDVLLTNRLILQPVVEASIVADDDPHRGVGKGLSSVEAGLRLRYEITRRFAPYVGFIHERSFGRTADMHRDAGEDVGESRWVAGVRFWF